MGDGCNSPGGELKSKEVAVAGVGSVANDGASGELESRDGDDWMTGSNESSSGEIQSGPKVKLRARSATVAGACM